MAQVTIEATFQAALGHHQAGQLAQAQTLYRQILEQRPKHAGALHYLGVVEYQSGHLDVAVDLMRRAIAIKPEYAEAYSNLATALRDIGQFEEAAAACRRAIALRPDYAEAYSTLGNALRDQGQMEEAVAVYRRAVALKPNLAEAFFNLGNALRELGQLDEAVAAFGHAIAVRPNYAEAYNASGLALRSMGQIERAIAAFRQAIVLLPQSAEAYSNLGMALRDVGQLDESIAACRQAIALKPEFPEAFVNLGIALRVQGRSAEAIGAYRQAIALRPGYAEAHSNLVYALHFDPGYDARSIALEHDRWNRQHAEPLKKFIQPHANDRNSDRRLRIGYVSPDFREHPIGRFLLPLLANHDKSQFEVFAYAQVLVPDSTTQRLRSYVDHWRNITGTSDAQAADLIRKDQIDVLVDLTMHMALNRLLVFARKPAPVQITYLAYCSSTGLQTIDYRLSDPYMDPPGGDESIYSERTIRLPDTYWCYEPIIANSQVDPLPASQRGFVTFGSLNNFCKASEPALAAWITLLRNVPNSQLLLHALEGSHRQRLRDRLEREGIDPTRVRFASFMPTQQYFDLYRLIDIALDTFPYGGGTTTCDALWMGVPTISLAGKTGVGRGGLSILSNIGLSELVADSEQTYVQLASGLASDVARLSQLRSTLRQRMQRSSLMDAPRFARNVEAAYRQMWQTWCGNVHLRSS
jgi:predicted O-linked N-acetylglucosamine transferase (SPINDLY family)